MIALSSVSGACSVISNTPDSATPTPTPTEPFTNEDYSAALRVASYRLRGRLPDVADKDAVLASGKVAYEPLIDKYLDPAQNPFLIPQMRGFYDAIFLMGGGMIDGVNFNEPANLALLGLRDGAPWSDVITNTSCYNDFFQPVACSSNTPSTHAAGALTTQAFLKKFGEPDTLNFRRMSLVHQVFNCGIYADPEDGAKWGRSNIPAEEWPCNVGTDGVAQWVAGSGCTCPVSVPANPALVCSGDDYLDPSLIPSANDPSIAPVKRVSKKYQGLQLGLNLACQHCHGSLLPRRFVFTPFDEEGHFDATRTIDDVESPEVNAGLDYCGTGGDTDLSGNPDDDDIDPLSPECTATTGEYIGVEVANLRELAQQIVSHDRFYECGVVRHYNFVLGKSQGSLGMNAGTGTEPVLPAAETLAKYGAVFQSNGWETRELMRHIFKGSEFLSSQAGQ